MLIWWLNLKISNEISMRECQWLIGTVIKNSFSIMGGYLWRHRAIWKLKKVVMTIKCLICSLLKNDESNFQNDACPFCKQWFAVMNSKIKTTGGEWLEMWYDKDTRRKSHEPWNICETPPSAGFQICTNVLQNRNQMKISHIYYII